MSNEPELIEEVPELGAQVKYLYDQMYGVYQRGKFTMVNQADPEVAADYERESNLSLTAEKVFLSWPQYLINKYCDLTPAVISPPPPPGEAKKKFIETLEEAFWEADGKALLVDLAKKNPLEFLKICVKLIPAELNSSNPRGQLAFHFHVEPDKDEKVIEGDFEKD
jgi:hypothetical protein